MNLPRTPTQMSLGRIILKLRLYRESVQYSQKATAEKLNLGYRSYQRIENEESVCDISFLYRFCDLFGADFTALASPHAPPIKNNLKIFQENEEEKFKNTTPVLASTIIFFVQKFSNKQVQFSDLISDSTFLNSKYKLCISTPFKSTYNENANGFFEYSYPHCKKGKCYSSIHDQVGYWDCIYYYRPKYSIQKIPLACHNKNVEMIEHSAHFYLDGNIISISILEFLDNQIKN